MSKKDNSTIWAVGAIIVVALILTRGGFTTIINQAPNVPLDPEFISSHYTLMLSVQPSRICVGDTATGTISSDIYGGICSVYLNSGTGWSLYKNVNLDSSGHYSETSPPMMTVGAVTFRAVCCDSEMNCKISNDAVLTVEACDGVPPDGVPPEECTDTDGGNDIYEAGVCTDNTHSNIDNCQSQTYVNENWCSNGECMGASMLCPTGYHCWDGECILTQQACTTILYPTSQASCSPGVCQTGNCIFVPATVYSIARCICE
jgi:hypothetical protein